RPPATSPALVPRTVCPVVDPTEATTFPDPTLARPLSRSSHDCLSPVRLPRGPLPLAPSSFRTLRGAALATLASIAARSGGASAFLGSAGLGLSSFFASSVGFSSSLTASLGGAGGLGRSMTTRANWSGMTSGGGGGGSSTTYLQYAQTRPWRTSER